MILIRHEKVHVVPVKLTQIHCQHCPIALSLASLCCRSVGRRKSETGQCTSRSTYPGLFYCTPKAQMVQLAFNEESLIGITGLATSAVFFGVSGARKQLTALIGHAHEFMLAFLYSQYLYWHGAREPRWRYINRVGFLDSKFGWHVMPTTMDRISTSYRQPRYLVAMS